VRIEGNNTFGGIIEYGLQTLLTGMHLAVHVVEGLDEVPGFRGRGARHVRCLLTQRRGFEGGNDVGDWTAYGVFEEEVAGGGQNDGDE